MKKTMQRLKNERGLTLVELLAVIVILAIVAVIAFVFIGGIIDNSKKDAHIANAQQIISAAKLHEATGGFSGSDTEMAVSELIEEQYLEAIIEPWTKDEYKSTQATESGESDAKVTKTDNVFTLSGFVPNEETNCMLGDVTEEDINKGDRKELCEGSNDD